MVRLSRLSIPLALLLLSAYSMEAQPARTVKRIVVVVQDERGRPVRKARIDLSTMYTRTRTAFSGNEGMPGTYHVDIPLSLVESPLKLKVEASQYHTYEKTQYWASQPKIVITLVKVPDVPVPPSSEQIPLQVTVMIDPRRGRVLEPVHVHWSVKGIVGGELESRFRLLPPRMSPDQREWSGWCLGVEGDTVLAGLNEQGTYSAMIEYREVASGKSSGVFKEAFSLSWEYTEPMVDDLNPNWDAVMSDGEGAGRRNALAREYERLEAEWSSQASARIEGMGMHISGSAIVERLEAVVDIRRLKPILESSLAQLLPAPATSLKGIITASKAFEAGRAAGEEFPLVYRDTIANTALSMAAIARAGARHFRTSSEVVAAPGAIPPAPEAAVTPELPSTPPPSAIAKESSAGGPEAMVLVEGGSFAMGSETGSSDEQPVRSVTIKPFYMDKTEVTVASYRKFCEATGRALPAGKQGDASMPVQRVTWEDASAYASWAGKRLPTEAEWEYAARGGNRSQGFQYSGSNNPDDVAWYEVNAAEGTHPVASKAPNEIGLYDMSGNVWEWCADWYSGTYYRSGAAGNPTGPTSGSMRVLRGGSWFDNADLLRMTNRHSNIPAATARYWGFRCAKDVTP